MLNIFTFLFFLFVSKKEEPTKIFDPPNPLQKNNEACISFIYICLKTDNADCNYFRKQCPPTNCNVLSNLINKCTKCQMNQSNLNLNGIKNQIKNSTSQLNGWTKYFPARIVAVCLTFILFNFLLIINIYVYLKVFNMDKYRRNRNTGDDENDLLLENQGENLLLENRNENERFQPIINENDVKLIQEIKEVNIKKDNVLLNEMKAMKNENGSTNTIEKKSSDKESCKTIEKKSSDKDKIFSHEKLRSFSDKYDQIYNLEASDIEECFEVVNKFNTEFMLPIIDCFKRKSIINEEMKLSLNCLFVSINIISKYAEHSPFITVSDSSLVCTFDRFVDMISSHHLAERICESILYTMCSLMKLSRSEVNKEFWKNKLEICFLNDKISEENKLASSVILVQLDISNIELMFQISEYLFNKIEIDCSQEYFGFTQSEIISARINAINKLANLLKAKSIDKNIDCYLFMIYLKKIIDLTLKLKFIQLNVNETDNIYNYAKKSSEYQCEKIISKSEKNEKFPSVCLNKFYFVNKSHLSSQIAEYIHSYLYNELHNQQIEINDNLSNILWNLFRNFEIVKFSSGLSVFYTPDRDQTSWCNTKIFQENKSNQEECLVLNGDLYVR